MRRGREGIESGHGDAHELALLVAAGRPSLEQLEGGQSDGGVAVARLAGLVDEVVAEGLAQARELLGGDFGDPQAYPALDGVVEFVGECVSRGGVGGEAFGSDVGECAGIFDDAGREVTGSVDAGYLDDGGRVPLVAACDLYVEDRTQRNQGSCVGHGWPLVGSDVSIVPDKAVGMHARGRGGSAA